MKNSGAYVFRPAEDNRKKVGSSFRVWKKQSILYRREFDPGSQPVLITQSYGEFVF